MVQWSGLVVLAGSVAGIVALGPAHVWLPRELLELALAIALFTVIYANGAQLGLNTRVGTNAA